MTILSFESCKLYLQARQLVVGDQVMTLEGNTQPVIWIGHRTVDCARHPKPEAVMPVCIRAQGVRVTWASESPSESPLKT